MFQQYFSNGHRCSCIHHRTCTALVTPYGYSFTTHWEPLDRGHFLRTCHRRRTHRRNIGETLWTNIPPTRRMELILVGIIFCGYVYFIIDKNCKYSFMFVLLLSWLDTRRVSWHGLCPDMWYFPVLEKLHPPLRNRFDVQNAVQKCKVCHWNNRIDPQRQCT